jgi:aspartate kinase
MKKTIVQKFGGSSLSSPELREVAASRVLEARSRGMAPVVVCSALGRSPDPYATDTLSALLGPTRGGANRDLLLACGEMIAASLFAELLTSWGVVAQAMTGAQAGIITDENYGDAKIIRVDATNVMLAVEAGVIPVVTGFQGVSVRGAITTLGRGGSDLTAIALGAALQTEMVEIYTDVSGVMTGDPRRIAGAHTIDRVEWSEMVELAAEGAKVMHAKGAELGRSTNTPYMVKGLRSNVGTTIDDGAAPDRTRPVTGITALRGISFVRIIQGDIDDVDARRELELALFERMAERDVSVDMINVNNACVMSWPISMSPFAFARIAPNYRSSVPACAVRPASCTGLCRPWAAQKCPSFTQPIAILLFPFWCRMKMRIEPNKPSTMHSA